MLPTLSCVYFLFLPTCGVSCLSLSLSLCVCVYACMCASVFVCCCECPCPVSRSSFLYSPISACCPPKPRTQATPDCTPMLYSRLPPCLKHSPLHPPHTGGAVRAGSRLQQDGALLLHEGAGRLLPRQRAGLVRRLAPRAPPVGLLLPPQVECLIRTGACRALLRSCFCFLREWREARAGNVGRLRPLPGRSCGDRWVVTVSGCAGQGVAAVGGVRADSFVGGRVG